MTISISAVRIYKVMPKSPHILQFLQYHVTMTNVQVITLHEAKRVSLSVYPDHRSLLVEGGRDGEGACHQDDLSLRL